MTIEIAGVSIAIDSVGELDDWDVDAAYRPFVSDRQADIHLRMLPGKPAISGAPQVFDSSPIWTLHRQGDRTAFKIFDHLNDQKRVLVLDPDIRTAELYFPNPDTDFVNPFYGPTIELLLIEYLARERGMIVHACGIDDGDRGMLFVGESGAGKSTLSNLWYQGSGAVFSDDRIIVRKKGSAYWMYGTPWHGEARFVSARSARLTHIFFLQHDQTNQIRPMNRADTVVEFLKASFPPFWDSQGVESAMAFLSDLTEAAPCRALSFKPDNSVIDFIKEQVNKA
ncbi:MAG: hypothetical protein R3274_01335 [Desulfobacterales bacterium]|nr:hypothetical protein [Desulfobacterales bacterium]